MPEPHRQDILELAVRLGRREGIERKWILWPLWASPPEGGQTVMAAAARLRARARAILAGEKNMPRWAGQDEPVPQPAEAAAAAPPPADPPAAAEHPVPPPAGPDFSAIDPPFPRSVRPRPPGAPLRSADRPDFSHIDPGFLPEDRLFSRSAAGRAACAAAEHAATTACAESTPPSGFAPPVPSLPAEGTHRPRRRRRAVRRRRSAASPPGPSWRAVQDLAVRLGRRAGLQREWVLWPSWASPPEEGHYGLLLAAGYRRWAREILGGKRNAPDWLRQEDEAVRLAAAAAAADAAAAVPLFPLPPASPGPADLLRTAPLPAVWLLLRRLPPLPASAARPPPLRLRRTRAGPSRASPPPPVPLRRIPIPVPLFDNRIAVSAAA